MRGLSLYSQLSRTNRNKAKAPTRGREGDRMKETLASGTVNLGTEGQGLVLPCIL